MVVEYTMSLSDHVKIGGGTAEEGLESLSMQLTQVFPILSHQGTSQRGQSLLLDETVDELNHTILAKFSGVTHTFAGYDKVVHETQGHYAEDSYAGYTPEYLQSLTPNGFPKVKWHSKWDAQ